jgi:hypothetical protein
MKSFYYGAGGKSIGRKLPALWQDSKSFFTVSLICLWYNIRMRKYNSEKEDTYA